jgi:hypothetical protein
MGYGDGGRHDQKKKYCNEMKLYEASRLGTEPAKESKQKTRGHPAVNL